MSDMNIYYVGEETKCLTLMWAVIWGFKNLQCISIVERVGICGFEIGFILMISLDFALFLDLYCYNRHK